jgi:protein-disulfide isomerase
MTTSKDSPFVDKYLTPIAVLLGAIIIAVAFAFGTGGTKPTTDEPGGAVAADIKNLKIGSSPVIGSATAPVTIAVWFDYQCPFCKRYELDSMEQIYTNYVQTGKVKVVLKDYQFLGPDSDTASVIARAVWEAYPEKFHDWYKAIMTAQDDENGGFGDEASVLALTKTVAGIDADKVAKLAKEKKADYQKAIAADRAEGTAFGINGTPGTLVGTKVLSGAVPYAQVSALIDAELKK